MRQVFAWFLLLISSTALAVPPGEVSSSAEAVCMMRAIGAQHPDPKLRNADTLAASFCPLPAEFASYEDARAGINLSVHRPSRVASAERTNAVGWIL